MDRQSEHYPGFDIYYEPGTKAREENRIEDEDEDEDEEGTKENSQPARKSKKAVRLTKHGWLGGDEEDGRKMVAKRKGE